MPVQASAMLLSAYSASNESPSTISCSSLQDEAVTDGTSMVQGIGEKNSTARTPFPTSKDDKHNESTIRDHGIVKNDSPHNPNEVWDLIRTVKRGELIPCFQKGCKKFAVVAWATNLAPDMLWYGCIGCQMEEFGGWPEGMEPKSRRGRDRGRTNSSNATTGEDTSTAKAETHSDDEREKIPKPEKKVVNKRKLPQRVKESKGSKNNRKESRPKSGKVTQKEKSKRKILLGLPKHTEPVHNKH